MKRLLAKLRAFRTRQDRGASAVEYGLLVALIAVVIAGTVVILGQALQGQFQAACDELTSQSDEDCEEGDGGGGVTP